MEKYFDFDETSRGQLHVKVENRVLGMMFLVGGRLQRYGNLLVDLQNQFVRDNDQFPKTLTDAYNLMVNYTPTFSQAA